MTYGGVELVSEVVDEVDERENLNELEDEEMLG